MFAGIDSGTFYTKCVLLNDGASLAQGIVTTGGDGQKSAERCIQMALQQGGAVREDLTLIARTGAVSAHLSIPGIQVDMPQCMARAALHLFPGAQTVVDVGYEDTRAVRVDAEGRIADMATQEKCAAGAGAYIENVSHLLGMSPEYMGERARQAQKGEAINAQCLIFAEYEIRELLQQDAAIPGICKSVLDALAGRIVAQIRRVGVLHDLIFMGGACKNLYLMDAVRQQLGVQDLHVSENPEYAPALGAALSAWKNG